MLIQLLGKHRPQNICEFGAGVFTDVFEQYCNKHDGKLVTIEHDGKYKHKDTALLTLKEHTAIIIEAYRFSNVNAYEGLENIIGGGKYDFVLIDGPFGWNSSYRYTRVQTLIFSEHELLNGRSIMIIHDSQRKSAKRTMRLLEKSLETTAI